MSDYLHKSMREFAGERIIVRKAKRKNKCGHGCPIGIGEMVILTDIEVRRNHANDRRFNICRPQRFCEKHGKEFLLKLNDTVNKSMIQINKLSDEIKKI